MPRPRISWLLVLVPVSLALALARADAVAVFATAALAIVPLAALIGDATEQIAVRSGPRWGGLLGATFGNVTEIIIAITLVTANQFEVVKASLIGSILGNMVLVLGLAFLGGGFRYSEQRFSARSAAVHSTALVLAVFGLMMPAVYVLTSPSTGVQRETVSAVVAVILIALYVASLVFTMGTHVHLFRVPEAGEVARWSLGRAVLVLAGAALVVGVESELLVHALEPTVVQLGVSRLFIGIFVVALVGNAAEHASAVTFALRNRVDVTIEIAFGSSTQIALFVAPLLVFVSLAIGHPMDFVFRTFEIVAVTLSTLIVSLVVLDGRTNWLEGAQLVGAYAIMAVSFLYVA